MKYRKLTDKEISLLKNNSCSSNNWKKIDVPGSFDCSRIQQVNFSGTIKIGRFDKDIYLQGGVKKPAGLYNCNIHNCIIEDNVLISNVYSIANYKIESDVVIENCGEIIVHGKTSFGNGTEIEVLNEAGGRELKIFDKLTAQTAYLIVMYRHKSAMIKKIQKMINLYIKARTSAFGKIKKGCKIINSIKLVNVEVGPFATVSGAFHLEEGTICSLREDPAVIGEGVIARNFIIHSGTKVDGSAMLDKCFVGQGVRIGKQFSAENSAFFANSEGFHGEACSVFAGPYTVTHHKSTLLIATMFSFFNAGSGTNQSNHMYKLGPVHQGILERGCKTGSFSYCLLPSYIGAYTAVIGKHYSNFDTSNLPFSYITEDNGKSIITPAMNLFTVGTKRDAEKWPARDRRKTSDKLDLINFTLFTPYIFRKMHTAAKVLRKLYENASKEQEFVNYNGIKIKRLMLKTCAKYYNIGLKIAIGKSVLSRTGEISDYKNFKGLK